MLTQQSLLGDDSSRDHFSESHPPKKAEQCQGPKKSCLAWVPAISDINQQDLQCFPLGFHTRAGEDAADKLQRGRHK